MDRDFELGIGRFKARQFEAIAEAVKCKRVRQILDAYNSMGPEAGNDPLIKQLTADASENMRAEHGLPVPYRRRLADSGETHTVQAIEVDGTLL